MKIIIVFFLIYASFANASGLSIMLRYVILMSNEEPRANNHSLPARCIKSCHELGHGIRGTCAYPCGKNNLLSTDTLNELLTPTIEMNAFVESRTLLTVVTKNRYTEHHCLQIEIFAVKGNYQK